MGGAVSRGEQSHRRLWEGPSQEVSNHTDGYERGRLRRRAVTQTVMGGAVSRGEQSHRRLWEGPSQEVSSHTDCYRRGRLKG